MKVAPGSGESGKYQPRKEAGSGWRGGTQPVKRPEGVWVSPERVQYKEGSRRAPRLPATRWMMLLLLRWRKTQGGSRMGLVMFERTVRHPSGHVKYTEDVCLGPGLEAHIWASSGCGWCLEPWAHPEATRQVKDGTSLI